jgi:hypothetical protein
MDSLIERHPVLFFAAAIAITVLLATFYIVLSEDIVSGFPWFAGFPHTTVAFASTPSLNCLRTCYFSAFEWGIDIALAASKTVSI